MRRRIVAAEGRIFTEEENLTVREYLQRWLEDAVRGTVRDNTYSRDRYLVTNHISPALGHLKLKSLNGLHLQGLYRDRLDAGLSGSTVLKVHHVIHKALSQAVGWDLIGRNPADAVKPPQASSKEMRPLSSDEARRLLEAARGERFEAFFVLALYTGMRRGEILGLKWSDVDLASHTPTVSVRRTLVRSGDGLALGPPKTKASRRRVILKPRAVEALRRHWAEQAREKAAAGGLYEDNGLVFASRAGGFVYPSNLRRRSLYRILDRAGLPRTVTFHDLRHTCASLLFQHGVHPKLVQLLLGHASVSITLDTYSHMLPGMDGVAAEALADALDAPEEPGNETAGEAPTSPANDATPAAGEGSSVEKTLDTLADTLG